MDSRWGLNTSTNKLFIIIWNLVANKKTKSSTIVIRLRLAKIEGKNWQEEWRRKVSKERQKAKEKAKKSFRTRKRWISSVIFREPTGWRNWQIRNTRLFKKEQRCNNKKRRCKIRLN